MGKKSEAPPPPDMSAVANASKESAALSYKLGQEQLAWAKEQFATNKQTTDQVVSMMLDSQSELNKNAEADRKRYEDVFQPQEDALINDANNYASAGRKDAEVGKAQAAVGQQFEAARDNATRQLESYGVNPASTRFAALDIGTRAQEAAAKAAAGTAAIDRTDAIARDLRTQAINVGKGYPAQSMQGSQLSQGAGTGAVNNNLATTASGASTMGTGTQWTGLGDNANASSANITNSAYKNQLDAYKANQSSSSGLGTLMGLAVTGAKAFGTGGASLFGDAASGAMSLGGPNGPTPFYAEGGAVDTGDATSGGAVPAGASPTRGKAVDDVPAQLTAGEFVMPLDVVKWKGTEYFHKEIEKARKASQQIVAKPEMRMAVPTAPTFQSRPQQGAIPMGA